MSGETHYIPRDKETEYSIPKPTPQQDAPAPVQRGVAAEVGIGKTTIMLDQLPGWIEQQKQRELPHRALVTVPDHGLSTEMFANLEKRGISSAVWKGRTYQDENEVYTMCMRPEAAELAAKYILDTERMICGKTSDEPERRCPFYDQCGYQRQKPIVAAADVIVAAHDVLFNDLPKEISRDLSLVVEDESWWQKGLLTHQEIGIADLASKILEFPPLRIAVDHAQRAADYPPLPQQVVQPGFAWAPPSAQPFPAREKPPRTPRVKKGEPPRPKEADDHARGMLHSLCVRLMTVLETLPENALVPREACRLAGITARDAHDAVTWEWQRKLIPEIHAGLSLADMRRAVAGAENNIQVKRRAGMWRALENMLNGTFDACGRLQVRTVIKQGEEKRVIWFHERKNLTTEILELPNLYLDATPPAVEITRSYLPHYQQGEMIRVDAPHQRVIQIIGPWAKTTLLPEPGNPLIAAEENARREAFLKEVRDFVIYHAQGEEAVIFSHKGAEQFFKNVVPNLRVGHFNKLRGQDVFGDVRHLFIVGRPFASPEQTRVQAMALTGEPLPSEQPQFLGQYVPMRDGSQRVTTGAHYDNPALEAVRIAITNAEIIQTVGRARGILREASDPVTIWLLTDVAVPWPLDLLLTWPEVAPTVWEQMAGRGLVLDSPADAAAFYPDLFVSRQAADLRTDRSRSGSAAWRRFTNIGEGPSFIQIQANDAMLRFHNVSYRPKGDGSRTREAWVCPTPAASIAVKLAAARKTELTFCRVTPPAP